MNYEKNHNSKNGYLKTVNNSKHCTKGTHFVKKYFLYKHRFNLMPLLIAREFLATNQKPS